MRIAIVTDTYLPQVNGVTTVVRRQVEVLREAGEAVAVVAPRYPGGREARDGELRMRSLPFPPYPDIRLSTPPYGAVRRYLDDFRPEVIHVTTEGPLGLVGRRYAVRRRLPLVTSFHTDFPRYTQDYGVGALEPVVWRWLLWFHGPAALTHTPGEAVRDRLVEHGVTPVTVWGRGVDTRVFRPGLRDDDWRRRHAVPENAAVVVHVGRLAPEKNLEVLAEAWILAGERLGNRAVFILVGAGPVERRLEARMPWVNRLGFLERPELARVYASSDICVLPSDTETLGLVALEAMASGTVVVAADAGGFRESIQDGVTGILVPPEEPEAFAAAIVDLVEDEERRRRLAREARRFAETRDVTREHAELLEQYRSTAAARP